MTCSWECPSTELDTPLESQGALVAPLPVVCHEQRILANGRRLFYVVLLCRPPKTNTTYRSFWQRGQVAFGDRLRISSSASCYRLSACRKMRYDSVSSKLRRCSRSRFPRISLASVRIAGSFVNRLGSRSTVGRGAFLAIHGNDGDTATDGSRAAFGRAECGGSKHGMRISS